MKEIKEKIEKLIETINRHNYLYYVKNQPIISDAEYDKLLTDLIELENKYPQFKSVDSPTQRIGSDILSEFQQREHKSQMKSLENSYSSEDIIDWYNRIKKYLADEEIQFVVELKIDGAGISVCYQDGILVYGLTRGDGKKGDDVTNNIKTIFDIPLKLEGNILTKAFVEIRGEVYMKKSVYKKLNEEREKIGAQLFANPRNAAAGSLKQLDANICRKRRLNAFFYSIGYIENNIINSQVQLLNEFKKAKLPVQDNFKLCNSIDDVIKSIEYYKNFKEQLDYEIDGLVIKVNEFKQWKKLGSTAKYPRFAIAYKYSAEKAEAIISSVDIQVGRTGILTPVANFSPAVHLSGTMVSRATLHNFDYIKELDIKINDTVLVEKAGEIIPKVVGVLKEKRTGIEKEIIIPRTCPECNNEIIKFQDEVAFRCINPKCPAQIKERITHYCSKNFGVNINIGYQTIDKLVEKKFINDIGDLYFLTYDQIMQIQGFKEKSTKKLLDSIKKSKSADFSAVLSGIGIPLVGTVTAELLTENFENIEALENATFEELTSIEGIGSLVAESIKRYFNLTETKNIINKLKKANVNLKSNKNKKSNKLENLVFVITGKLGSGMPRNEFIKIIKDNGGKVLSSITKEVNYLIASEKTNSTKFKKAEAAGIKVINEEEFYKLLG